MAGIALPRLKGPLRLEHQTIKFHSKEGVTFKPNFSRTKIAGDFFRFPDDMEKPKIIVELQAETNWLAGPQGVLFNQLTLEEGDSIMPNPAAPLIVRDKKGNTKITFHCACVYKMPNLLLKNGTNPFQSFQFAVYPIGDPTDANSWYTVTSEAYPADDTYTAANGFRDEQWALTWDGGGLPAAMRACDGWRVEFDAQIEEDWCDGMLLDVTMEGISVKVTGTPNLQGLDDALDAMRLQGASSIFGTTPAGGAITIANADDSRQIFIYGALLLDGTPLQGGRKLPNIGDLVWEGFGTNNVYPIAALDIP